MKGGGGLDRYKKLISNTLIFAIGTFSSKVLVFLLIPFYTHVLAPAEFSVADLIVQTANLIIPVSSIGMSNAIIRFGLDRAADKRDVFSGGIAAIGGGYLLFLILYPLLSKVPTIGAHTYLVYFYVLTATLRSLCSQFVRSRELVRLYAFDGVLSTATVLIFNILFLAVFRLGIVGYVMATIISDALSTIFLFTIANLRRYIRFRGMDWSILGSMVRYALPLIPTTVFWWITNVSDRYFVSYMLGNDINGLYGIAYKIPTAITLVSGFFTDAWQMSAVTEDGPGRDRFYSKVFGAYQALVFSAAAGLILFAKPITYIFMSGQDGKYYASWQYIPFLVMATSFSCFVTFLGSVYMVEKKTVSTLVTTVAGAVLNILLNFLLIPTKLGANGAAFATFISYFVVFVLRAIDTRRYVKIRWNAPVLVLNLVILLAQALVLLLVEKDWILPEAVLCLLMLAVNFRQILINVQKVLARRKRA